jgi:uncharacterized protein (TIGR02246 family)
MTHSARLSALLLPVALLASISAASAGAQNVLDAKSCAQPRTQYQSPVRHACRTDNHSTPRVEQSLEIVMSNAEEQLRTLLAGYETALNAGDAGRIEQLYTEDGVFMPAGFATASGRKAVRGAYDAVFSNIRIAIHFTVDELTVKGDVAYARTHSAGTATVVATGASGPEANRELFVFAGGANGWKIARYMFNKES